MNYKLYNLVCLFTSLLVLLILLNKLYVINILIVLYNTLMKPFKLSLLHVNDTFDTTNVKQVYNTLQTSALTFNIQETNKVKQKIFDSLQTSNQIQIWHYIFIGPITEDIKDVLSIFDDLVLDNLKIWCDTCNIKIGLTTIDVYYHSNIAGDLCDKCFNSKKKRYYEHINYIKKKILLLGRIEVFKKEVIKTRKFLKKRKYKIKKKKKITTN